MSKSTVISFGQEYCVPDKEITYGLYQYNMLHFIFEGEGYFKDTKLHAGQGFLCRQNSKSAYYPDKDNPWVYAWINMYSGEMFDELCKNITFTSKDTFEFDLELPYAFCLINMQETKSKIKVREGVSAVEAISILSQSVYYNILSLLTLDSHRNKSHIKESSTNTYADTAIELINHNYHRSDFNVGSIVNKLHISSGYLRSLFSEQFGISPQEYLLKVRMEMATEYLTTTEFPISLISSSVGYSDQHNFSKMYRKFYNMSPSSRRFANKIIQKE